MFSEGVSSVNEKELRRKQKGVSYAKWGYLFILPFFLAYFVFTFAPQVLTIYNSFFENYREGLKQVGPNFVGFGNYVKLFTPDKSGTINILKYAGNTLILWLLGAVPQILIALLLAIFFTSYRLNIKGQQFFKTVIYMPNLIMASERCAHRLLCLQGHGARPDQPDELPHVVRQYHDPADGGHHGH